MPPGIGIPPPTTIEYVNEYLPYLMGNDVKPDETYTYGERIIGRKLRPGKDALIAPVNQMQTVIDMFKSAGEGTNQATIEIARPEDCGTKDPPCVRLIDCRLRYGLLHFFVYVRSWDLWGGFPVNLASIEMMKSYMAAEIGCGNGEIVAMSKGLHIYGYAEELAKLRVGRVG
jgi:thymidylate synthase